MAWAKVARDSLLDQNLSKFEKENVRNFDNKAWAKMAWANAAWANIITSLTRTSEPFRNRLSPNDRDSYKNFWTISNMAWAKIAWATDGLSQDDRTADKNLWTLSNMAWTNMIAIPTKTSELFSNMAWAKMAWANVTTMSRKTSESFRNGLSQRGLSQK